MGFAGEPNVSLATERMSLLAQRQCSVLRRDNVSLATQRMFLSAQREWLSSHRDTVSLATEAMSLFPQTEGGRHLERIYFFKKLP